MSLLAFENKSVFRDPDTAYLINALDAIEKNDYCIKQFKTDFLKSSREAKREVRMYINSLIEFLKEREAKLCQKIDERILQVVFWNEESPRDSLLDSSNHMCSQPALKVNFVCATEDLHSIHQKIKEFGSIQLGREYSPEYLEARKIAGSDIFCIPDGTGRFPQHSRMKFANPQNGMATLSSLNVMPSGCSASPMNIDTQRTSPESAGSADSFDVISDSDFAESPSKPVPEKISVRNVILQAIEKSLENCPSSDCNPMKTIIIPEVWASSPTVQPIDEPRAHDADSTTQRDLSPSSVIREKFGEYLCKDEQEKWLASPQRM